MNPFEQYKLLLDESLPVAQRYLAGAGSIVDTLSNKIEERKLQVMLFGAYNAGKSTLINTLLASERAVVDDVPTTDKVDHYDWDGHVLLDTPGVNAPIEHEKVTSAQLEHVDLVLFVLRQEDQDAQDVMSRIFELLERKRPLFIVLNYENSDAALIERVQSTFNQTFLRLGAQRGFSEEALARVPLILMNVKSACKGRIEGKSKLLEHSRFDVFMTRFTTWLKQYDSEQKLLESTCDSIERTLLKPVTEAIANENSVRDELGDVMFQIDHIKREYRILANTASNRIRAELISKRPAVGAAIDQASSPETMQAALSEVGESVAQSVQTWLEVELQSHHKARISAALKEAGLDPSKYQTMSESEWLDKIVGPLMSQLKGVNKEHVLDLLKFGRSLKIPGLKGRWLKTLDKWAGRAAPLLQVALIAVDIGMEHHGQQQENERRISQALQRNQWIEEICAEFQSRLVENVDEVVRLVMEEGLRPLEKQVEELSAVAGALEKDRAVWVGLGTKFREVRF